jgi:ribosome-binding protein aMBF1 (putative translation factor)
MKNWKTFKKELLKKRQVAKEYKKLEPRYLLISQLIEARIKKRLSQKQLAEKIGTKQSAIARLESGEANPTIAFLEKIASAMGYELSIKVK